MRFMQAQDMMRGALAVAMSRSKEETDKRGGESGNFTIDSPDGLTRLSCHSWQLISYSFTVFQRDTTSREWSGANSYTVSEDFAEGFLKALNVPVKE